MGLDDVSIMASSLPVWVFRAGNDKDTLSLAKGFFHPSFLSLEEKEVEIRPTSSEPSSEFILLLELNEYVICRKFTPKSLNRRPPAVPPPPPQAAVQVWVCLVPTSTSSKDGGDGDPVSQRPSPMRSWQGQRPPLFPSDSPGPSPSVHRQSEPGPHPSGRPCEPHPNPAFLGRPQSQPITWLAFA